MPAFVLMLILSSLYAKYHAVPRIVSLFNGLQVVVVAVVANATYSFGKTTFKGCRDFVIALAASFLFGSGISPFIVILGAAAAGIVLFRSVPGVPERVYEREKDERFLRHFPLLLLVPVLGLLVLYLMDAKLFNLAALMMRIDLFAFGGGFASLPLMLHEISDVRGWMDNKTFIDGIALGQVTPGPIVITATFVGYLIHGTSGAIVATLAVFTPSFLMVVVITPIFDRLKASAYFLGATKGILASFVGLLFFVTVIFALAVPWDIIRALLVCAAFVALYKKMDILPVMLITAVISIVVF